MLRPHRIHITTALPPSSSSPSSSGYPTHKSTTIHCFSESEEEEGEVRDDPLPLPPPRSTLPTGLTWTPPPQSHAAASASSVAIMCNAKRSLGSSGSAKRKSSHHKKYPYRKRERSWEKRDMDDTTSSSTVGTGTGTGTLTNTTTNVKRTPPKFLPPEKVREQTQAQAARKIKVSDRFESPARLRLRFSAKSQSQTKSQLPPWTPPEKVRSAAAVEKEGGNIYHRGVHVETRVPTGQGLCKPNGDKGIHVTANKTGTGNEHGNADGDIRSSDSSKLKSDPAVVSNNTLSTLTPATTATATIPTTAVTSNHDQTDIDNDNDSAKLNAILSQQQDKQKCQHVNHVAETAPFASSVVSLGTPVDDEENYGDNDNHHNHNESVSQEYCDETVQNANNYKNNEAVSQEYCDETDQNANNYKNNDTVSQEYCDETVQNNADPCITGGFHTDRDDESKLQQEGRIHNHSATTHTQHELQALPHHPHPLLVEQLHYMIQHLQYVPPPPRTTPDLYVQAAYFESLHQISADNEDEDAASMEFVDLKASSSAPPITTQTVQDSVESLESSSSPSISPSSPSTTTQVMEISQSMPSTPTATQEYNTPSAPPPPSPSSDPHIVSESPHSTQCYDLNADPSSETTMTAHTDHDRDHATTTIHHDLPSILDRTKPIDPPPPSSQTTTTEREKTSSDETWVHSPIRRRSSSSSTSSSSSSSSEEDSDQEVMQWAQKMLLPKSRPGLNSPKPEITKSAKLVKSNKASGGVHPQAPPSAPDPVLPNRVVSEAATLAVTNNIIPPKSVLDMKRKKRKGILLPHQHKHHCSSSSSELRILSSSCGESRDTQHTPSGDGETLEHNNRRLKINLKLPGGNKVKKEKVQKMGLFDSVGKPSNKSNKRKKKDDPNSCKTNSRVKKRTIIESSSSSSSSEDSSSTTSASESESDGESSSSGRSNNIANHNSSRSRSKSDASSSSSGDSSSDDANDNCDSDSSSSTSQESIRIYVSENASNKCSNHNAAKPKLKTRGKKSNKVAMSKQGKMKKKYLSDDDDEDDMDIPHTTVTKSRPLTTAEINQILADDDAKACTAPSASNWVRRSTRQPSRSGIMAPNVRSLVDKLVMDDTDMVVLKLKKYLSDPDTPPVVIDTMLDALEGNTNCEALYIQNFNEGMRDEQVLHLLRILQKPSCKIWCLNIGETYKVKRRTWATFTNGLKKTKITHMYASEHTISGAMKEKIREVIRCNRKKHNLHISPDNLDVIIQCTHCWWNPINAKVLRPYILKSGYEHILLDKVAQGTKDAVTDASKI